MKHSLLFSISVISALMLSGCSGTEVKESLGLMRKSPDEFKVVARPKLSVPPEFHLAPPREGQQIDFGSNPEQDARALITQDKAAVAPGDLASTNDADAQFLLKAGADEANPNIREQLGKETLETTKQDTGWLESLRGETGQEPVVDAKAEALRIQENKSEGKAVTEGETPVVDPQDKSTLERLFD